MLVSTIPESLATDGTAATLARALGIQYQLQRVIGRGGMGVVYLAREPFLERDVAVKVLPADMASGDARERFLREARTAARLSHPNIVPLYTFGESGDLLYYVMGFVEGESLESRLRRDGRLPPDEARRITSELASALEYAHQLGVVHRDIKPDNVLLDRATGRAMLTDFGVAKQRAGVETLTQAGVIVGTPHYMSPEQASGDRDLDGRSDIYALGVLAYRMSTGRLPFEGATLRDVLVQHATHDPLPPSQLVAALPLDLDAVILRALAKAPSDRWPNAGTMREALAPDSEEAMPEELRNIADVGTNVSFIGAGLMELAYVGSLYGGFTGIEAVGVAACGAVLPGLALLNAWRPARRFGWRAALRVTFRQPGWWRSWWPEGFRRPGDIWHRLPIELRGLRRTNVLMLPSALIMANYLLFVTRESFIMANPGFHDSGVTAALAFGFAGVIYSVLAVHGVRLRRWQRQHGISKSDMRRWLQEATFGSAFWTRPHVAALLAPDAPRVASAAAATAPQDLLREIEAIARAEQSSPQGPLFADAVQAASAACALLAQVDRQLAQLAHDADPRERQRVQESLAALGTGDTLSPAKAQMRELLARQLDVFRDLDARHDLLGARRDRLREQLRTLALQVAQLRAAHAADAAGATEITGRVQALCRELQYRVDGLDAVR